MREATLPPIIWHWVEVTYPHRLVLGLLFFLVLGVRDVVRHPDDPKRAREYFFLVYSALVAVVYAVVHDQITATLSPEYFVLGKGLIHDERPFRVSVAILAAHASYGVGALAGALLLIANNPSSRRAQVPYRSLARLALVPLAFAAVGAVAGGVVNRVFDPMDLAHDLRGEIAYSAVRPFVLVQGAHAGSYAGAVLGTIVAVVLVRRRRGPALQAGPAQASETVRSPGPTSSSGPPPS